MANCIECRPKTEMVDVARSQAYQVSVYMCISDSAVALALVSAPAVRKAGKVAMDPVDVRADVCLNLQSRLEHTGTWVAGDRQPAIGGNFMHS